METVETNASAVQDAMVFEWPRNPFPGLRPFREDEALTFYGRNSHKNEGPGAAQRIRNSCS